MQIKHLHHRGISLLELILAMGIFTIVILTSSTLVYQLMGAQNLITTRDQMSEFITVLSRHFQNPSLCKATMAATPIIDTTMTPFTVANFTNYQSDYYNPPDVPPPVGPTFMITKGARLNSLEIGQKPGAVFTFMYSKKNPPGPDLKFYRTTLQVKLVPELANTPVQTDPPATPLPARYFEFPVLTNNNVLPTAVVECGGTLSMDEVCIAAGGSPAGSTCDLSGAGGKKCRQMGGYTVYSQSDYNYPSMATSPLINPMTGDASCPVGSIPSMTGGRDWSENYSCGKKCTATVRYNEIYYSCLICDSP